MRTVPSLCPRGCATHSSVINGNISVLQITINNMEMHFSQECQRLSLPLFEIIWREDTEYGIIIASSVIAPRSFTQAEFYVGNSDHIISKPSRFSHSLYDK